MKYALALLVAAFAVTSAHAYEPSLDIRPHDLIMVTSNDALYDSTTFAPTKRQDRMAQAGPTTTVQTSAPVTSTTVVKGGDLAAQVIDWLKIAFGTVIAGIGTMLIVKIRAYFGVLTTSEQKDQLQNLAVNAVNSAASKAEDALRRNPNLDINVKDAVIADAVNYVQSHGADTIKALGLDPKSGDAVEAIKARIATAMNGPDTPTVTATAVTSQPLAPKA